MSVNTAPTITKIFVIIMQFHLPSPKSGPAKSAPIADPAVPTDWEKA